MKRVSIISAKANFNGRISDSGYYYIYYYPDIPTGTS